MYKTTIKHVALLKMLNKSATVISKTYNSMAFLLSGQNTITIYVDVVLCNFKSLPAVPQSKLRPPVLSVMTSSQRKENLGEEKPQFKSMIQDNSCC